MVPQEPMLFSGALRRNLDPADKKTDDEIWDGLRSCGLSALVTNLEGGLQADVKDTGSNFSLGERQVFCMARALLHGTRILCLDEATANVDPENDARIQRMLRSQFMEHMVLTIAHRLHTVMSADRIMVLDAGRLIQFDSPQRLLETPGPFLELAREPG